MERERNNGKMRWYEKNTRVYRFCRYFVLQNSKKGRRRFTYRSIILSDFVSGEYLSITIRFYAYVEELLTL